MADSGRKSAATAKHGYSGRPLFQKLGLKPGMTCLTVTAPDDYLDLVHGVEDVEISADLPDADVVHMFCTDLAVFEDGYTEALSRVRSKGMLWVSWPKKSSKMFIDLVEDDLRRLILPTGWVDVKVCAINQDWSGLKFLRRKT